MKQKIWLVIAISFIAAILAIFLFSLFGVRRRVDNAQTSGEMLYRIYGERKVGQTFVAGHNQLNVISLDLKNAALKNKSSLDFCLEDGETGQELRRIEINGLNVGDPSTVRFQFEPLADSAGKRLYFYLESPSSTVDDSMEIFHSENDVYGQGEMRVNEESLTGDLRFTTSYYPRAKTVLAQETLSDFTARFFHDKSFVFFYFILLLTVFAFSVVI